MSATVRFGGITCRLLANTYYRRKMHGCVTFMCNTSRQNRNATFRFGQSQHNPTHLQRSRHVTVESCPDTQLQYWRAAQARLMLMHSISRNVANIKFSLSNRGQTLESPLTSDHHDNDNDIPRHGKSRLTKYFMGGRSH